MPKITMDMPDLPDGWEYTGEWRHPKEGERYMFTDDVLGQPSRAAVDFQSLPYPIVRRKWSPPECLRGKGLTLHLSVFGFPGEQAREEVVLVCSGDTPGKGNCNLLTYRGQARTPLAKAIGFTTEGMPPIPPEGLPL